ncbi:MAG: beta-ketoacyl-[acyl-carrier-protein] synthase family protein [Vicinamibacteria bacterium]
MTGRHRVVVTGVGQVSALGNDIVSFSAAVFDGRSGVRHLEGMTAPGLDDPVGAPVQGFDPEAWLPARALSTTPRAAQFAAAAARQAFAMAGLDVRERERGGVFVGTGFGGIAESEATYRACFTEPGRRPGPTVIPMAMANATAGVLASELRLKGENLTYAVACASGTHAIGQAFRRLRGGDLDLILAGGADAPLTPIVLAAWNVMRVLAPAGADPSRACRPFSRDRRGIVVGEGAAFLVLETAEHAGARGARPIAEIVGYGANADASHPTHPDAAGVAHCMGLALADAGLTPDAIGYVGAHGTGTAANDAVEAGAVASVFGPRSSRLPVSSTKAIHGHAMGAGGALETLATILALSEGRLPPTAHLTEVDPALPELDFVRASSRKVAVEYAVKNSFAFGGNNAVLVLRRA